MSQYYAKIHIKVSSPEIWNRFKDNDDAGLNLASCADSYDTSYFFDDEWSADERELRGIVKALSETLDKDGIVIAYTTNINVDPYRYSVFYLGSYVHTELFDEEYKSQMLDAYLGNIPEWLTCGEFSISKTEREVLLRCGIVDTGDGFSELFKDIHLNNKVYLRETSFNNRAEIIERLVIGENVYLIQSASPEDALRLEVMNANGSLGYLPSHINELLTPLMMSNHLDYSAKVCEIVPLSKRNKHAKSPIVAIKIRADYTEETIEP